MSDSLTVLSDSLTVVSDSLTVVSDSLTDEVHATMPHVELCVHGENFMRIRVCPSEDCDGCRAIVLENIHSLGLPGISVCC